MRNNIGDEYSKSPIHRLFEEGEEEIAMDYLIQSHKDGFKIIGIDMESGEPTGMPEEFMDTIYRSFMASMYGVNITTIANMWKVQTTFMDKYCDPLMKYLQYTNAKVEYYEFVPNSIALPYMAKESRDKGFAAVDRWDPMQKWKSMYVEDKRANLVSPFNIFVNAKIVITNPNEEFLKAAVPNPVQRDELKEAAKQQGTDIKLIYSLLPNDNFNKILNVIDMIHRYI